MKIKKRYFVACILMCVVALALSVAVFYFEMGLARYSKLNNVVSKTWIQTSASEPGTGVNSDFFITKAYDSLQEEGEVPPEAFDYIGKRTRVDGKYLAYGESVYASDHIFNGDFKLGDRVSVYYKPDNPTTLYMITNYMPYIICLAAVVVIAIVMIFLCRIINKSLKDNTFTDSAVTIMDIPMVVIVAGVILAFFAGMLIGNIQVGPTYTAISKGIADMYAAHELVI